MPVNKELRQKAEDLGITVDSRWSDTVIQQKIDEKEADNDVRKSGSIIPGSGVEDDAGPSKEALAGAAVDDKGKVLPTEGTPKALHAGPIALDEKSTLRLKAQQLGIMVDDKWEVGRLRGEIQMAREGRADWQIKGAVPPSEYEDVNYDPATKADKRGVISGVIPPAKTAIDVPGVTIAGQPAVAVPGPVGGAIPKSAVVPADTGGGGAESRAAAPGRAK